MIEFRDFIKKQLRIAKIDPVYCDKFTEDLSIWRQAFTHWTYDPVNNYQELEFVGDGILKGILSQYIIRRWPELKKPATEKPIAVAPVQQFGKKKFVKPVKKTAEGPLSMMRRSLEQRKTLSDIAKNLGFWEQVIADQDTINTLRTESLEDVFEAFIGALVTIIDTRSKRGLGYNYAYNYVEYSLDKMEFDTSMTALNDPITRLNELYKANELAGGVASLKWGDAVYFEDRLLAPIMSEKPPTASSGDVIFFKTEQTQGAPFVYFNGSWNFANKLPLIKLNPFPTVIEYDEENNPLNMQPLWNLGAYGFPSKLGTPAIDLHKITRDQIKNNPRLYGAAIIGQGLNFTKQKAKEAAAVRALEYLEAKGYSK